MILGPLSQRIGDLINAETNLILYMGTSEAGWLTAVETDREDWNYLHFHPNTGLELRLHTSGLFELYAVRKPELEKWQIVFSTFPDLQEYCFNDLFSPHPTKKDLWHYEGRADDIIVFSNGEKFNPLSLEQLIERHPLVRSVLLAGQARFQTSAIIELANNRPLSKQEITAVIDELWPTIEEGNKASPRHAKLLKDYILLASPTKPFSRAGKGTIQRGLTLNQYAEELDDLYTQVENDSADSLCLNMSDIQTLAKEIRLLV